ncbi:Indoleamine 2,3-dioxygenase [Pseudovirgaria hyperparasitica]|uniref:Indoleamine 2,3-dioxygenase n=1 Tax=Pseudovirgaria hyperparasitica TaxID=470096 RepID=A0A6A6WDA3_9PEZI|nr:Indoleamine 2,3-dioxygenase [Pseudovirgaria hyperparasitica]KAF2759836.1 Indoleamine 2,3-dioxygenase [Pseudovirgaria hyperparasitica]
MGVHVFPSSTTQTHTIPCFADLSKYAVTENGFLPADLPLRRLPRYYEPWEAIITKLSKLLAHDLLHDEIRHLPILSVHKLQTVAEWRRAYVILAFFTHGYIWGGPKPSEILPPQVAVPFAAISQHLELPPVATYAALNLWNFTSASPDFSTLDALQSLHTMTGTLDEAWFYLVSVAVEAQGAPAIQILLRAMESAEAQDYTGATQRLEEIVPHIHRLGKVLMRMSEKCDPDVFYDDIRPFLAGSKNMASAGLPNGVFYDYGDGRGEWMQVRGGSNAQSSLIQFLDLALGVRHESNGEVKAVGTGPVRSFHEEMRDYMPGPHRRFLEDVSAASKIQEFALRPGHAVQQTRLRDAYQAALQALSDFRGLHLQIVTKYIIIPSRRSKQTLRTNLASMSSDVAKQKDGALTGTGGTDLMPFLKQTRQETEDAGKTVLH